MALLDALFNSQTFAPGQEQMSLLQRLMPMLAQTGMLQQGSGGFPPVSPPTDVSAASPPPQMPQTVAPQMPPQMSQQGGSPFAGIGNFLQQNSLPLMMLGAGIAGGKNWGEGISKGLAGAATVKAKSNEDQRKTAIIQQTYQMLRASGMPHERAVLGALNPTVFSATKPDTLSSEAEAQRIRIAGANKDPRLLTPAEEEQKVRIAQAGATKINMNDTQSNAATYADRMYNSERVIRENEKAGASIRDKAAAGVPIVGNYLTSDQYKAYDQAKRDFVNAVLRKESGAVISPSEFANAEKQYFPQPGDSDAVITQKRRNREVAMQGIARAAGNLYKPPELTPEGVKAPIDYRDYIRGSQ